MTSTFAKARRLLEDDWGKFTTTVSIGVSFGVIDGTVVGINVTQMIVVDVGDGVDEDEYYKAGDLLHDATLLVV